MKKCALIDHRYGGNSRNYQCSGFSDLLSAKKIEETEEFEILSLSSFLSCFPLPLFPLSNFCVVNYLFGVRSSLRGVYQKCNVLAKKLKDKLFISSAEL